MEDALRNVRTGKNHNKKKEMVGKKWFTDRACPRRNRIQDTMQIDADPCSIQTRLSLHQSRSGLWHRALHRQLHLHGSQKQGNFYRHLVKAFHKAHMNNHCRMRLTEKHCWTTELLHYVLVHKCAHLSAPVSPHPDKSFSQSFNS